MHGERINIHSLLYSILISANFQIFKMHYLLIHCNLLRWKFAEMKEKYEKDVCLFVHYVWIIKLSRNAWKWKFKVWSPGLKTEEFMFHFTTLYLYMNITFKLRSNWEMYQHPFNPQTEYQSQSDEYQSSSTQSPSYQSLSYQSPSYQSPLDQYQPPDHYQQLQWQNNRYKVLDGPKDFFCKKKSGAGAAKKLASSSALLEENS